MVPVLYGAFAAGPLGDWPAYSREHFVGAMSRHRLGAERGFVVKPVRGTVGSKAPKLHCVLLAPSRGGARLCGEAGESHLLCESAAWHCVMLTLVGLGAEQGVVFNPSRASACVGAPTSRFREGM